jgi:hypothetical protein
MKVKYVQFGSENLKLRFHCPACNSSHSVVIRGNVPAWDWNGDYEKPTFSPSILVTHPVWVPEITEDNWQEWCAHPWQQTQHTKICHSFVRDGQIQYLTDCTHELAGKTVDLPDLPDLPDSAEMN